MIFIGGVQPKTKRLEGAPRTCPSCGTPQLFMKRTDHYISLFFIPIFPISRGKPFLSCDRCGGIFDERGGEVGSPLRRGEKRCPGCGERMDPSFTYCPFCGRRV